VIIHIPQPRSAIISAGEKQFPIRRKNYIFHRSSMALEAAKLLPGLGIP
jgi:hypothetical protein